MTSKPLIVVDEFPHLILASTSVYRHELLARLRLPFEVVRPDVSEDYLDRELPPDRALRLALAKADAVAARYPQAVVIGSDQVAAQGLTILDKPGDAENARAQLARLSGSAANFHTACAVVRHSPGFQLTHVETTHVVFRTLSGAEIERYVQAEPAFDCAGGAKAEGLGISLVECIDSGDPTALIGLPLVWLARALREIGYQVP